MSVLSEDKATTIANELKALIRRFEHRSFTAHLGHMGNAHVRQRSGQIKLRSPVRQLMYLMSLYHATDLAGTEIYTPASTEHRQVIRLLNEIEKGYGYETVKSKRGGLSQEEFDRLLVTKGTFLNYYLNAPLSYFEQDIERIKRTFQHFEPYILQETGLALNDYLDFFAVLTNLEIGRVSKYLNNDYGGDPILQSIKRGKKPKNLTTDQKVHLMDIGEKAVYEMAIPLEEIYKVIDKEKARHLLAHFTLIRKEDSGYLYYTDNCGYLRKPIIMMDGQHILMVYSKQLINAIYEFLFELCAEPEAPGRKISARRDDYLEEKTTEVFRDFFGPEAGVYTSYAVNGAEKDLLVLSGRNAFIIECKAHKYREPLRDSEKAYDRIRDDFGKSIGKGYQQAKEVEDLLLGEQHFTILDKKKKVMATLRPEDYDEIFTLVVTQERFGQIQCDLKYLLDIADDCNYPWSVAINDLETFLITLKRKDNHLAEFTKFLLARERLHERVMCYDELELCAYFLFDNEAFIRNCYREEIFFSSPDMNLFFDLFYQVGFGFKDELNLADKVKRRHFEAENVIRFHKLKPAKRVAEFLNQSPEK
jgi:hypothetical protein